MYELFIRLLHERVRLRRMVWLDEENRVLLQAGVPLQMPGGSWI